MAVGTALAGGPPHRSQRAGLPHWAPASGLGVEALRGVGVHDPDGWEPLGGDAVHSGPVEPCPLAAALKRLVPVAGHLGPEARDRPRASLRWRPTVRAGQRGIWR